MKLPSPLGLVLGSVLVALTTLTIEIPHMATDVKAAIAAAIAAIAYATHPQIGAGAPAAPDAFAAQVTSPASAPPTTAAPQPGQLQATQ